MEEEVTTTKKEAKMRTSITISPAVLEKLRTVCETSGVSVSSYIEKAVTAAMSSTDDVDRV